MGLKQDIIVVNEYTVPLPSGKGSRGGTPGQYIERYMARELATEPVTPIRRYRTDRFIERYMAREEATERITVPDTRLLKKTMRDAQGDGGVAFGYGEVALSDDQLHAGAQDVQRLFEDEGHTVMKTVVSFSEEYLRKHGLIPEEFSHEKRGDYRGHLDQLKLRMAIMHGLNRMARSSYDDLRYVGVIQVDSNYAHCHLAMVDAGEGTRAADGTQKGKISPRSISLLRRGMDSWLDEKQQVKHLSSAVGYERRNVTTYVKKWAHQQMLRESLPQLLIATLPEDRRLWRLGTNRQEMNKPNRIVREIVEGVLDAPDSPMVAAMDRVKNYANERREQEDLLFEQWSKLVETGRNQIIERGVNAVYASLRQLPEDSLRLRTPMLDAMGMDYEELTRRAHESTEDDDLVSFGYRLRSYSHRLQEHNDLRQTAHARVRDWEVADEKDKASVESQALLRFWLMEEEYQARCASKYRSFLTFVPPESSWSQRWEKVADYNERLMSLTSMRNDATLRKMKDPDEAEAMGREIYEQYGGHLVSIGDKNSLGKLDERIRKMRIEQGRKLMDLQAELAGEGLHLDVERGGDGALVPEISVGPEHVFEDVKALDLHRMRYDFSNDVEVGPRSLKNFQDWTKRRQETLAEAVAYLQKSDQEPEIENMPVREVGEQVRLSAELGEQTAPVVLPSKVAELARKRELVRRSRTITLTEQVQESMASSVREAAARALEAQPESELSKGRDTPVS